MKNLFYLFLALIMLSCKNTPKEANKPIHLVTLDPGHFHAALIQKSMYDSIDPIVHLYAPVNDDVKQHLGRVESYNKRTEKPTAWQQVNYINDDFLEKMLSEKKGNVVVLSGNNGLKTDYIAKSLQNGYHVLADKPMVINEKDFEKLKQAFATASENKKLLYDIMTERSEITTILQRELSQDSSVFGALEHGTPQNPAITKESVHHFYKFVSGNVVKRPTWFMDVNQQGEGIVDVMTHLVDLVQWASFPNQTLDYTKDIKINTAKRWATNMTLSQFQTITKTAAFPDFLKKIVLKDTILPVFCNGEINYLLRGVCAKTSVIWNYKAPDGTGDTHQSIMRGTKANLAIRQTAEEKYESTLYIEPLSNSADYALKLKEAFIKIQQKYPNVTVEAYGKKWKVVIPTAFKESHEAHFARVTERFLEYVTKGNMPEWEVPNMLAKYYTTTKAFALSR
jgi:predicted dehydrogenase